MQRLREIAGEMWAAATVSGRAMRVLPGGLTILVRVDGTERRLGLMRETERVPYDEAGICKAAFGVPSQLWPEEIPLGGKLWKCYTWQTESAEQAALPF